MCNNRCPLCRVSGADRSRWAMMSLLVVPKWFVLWGGLLFAAPSFAAVPAADQTNPADVYYQKAAAYFQQGEFRSAAIDLKNTLQLHPQHAAGQLLLARCLLVLGDGAGAEIALNKAIQLGAKDAHLPFWGLQANLLQGKWALVQQAPIDMSMPVAILAQIRATQGQAYLLAGDIKTAKSLFNRAYQLSPETLEAQVGQVKLWLLAGQEAAARALILRVQKQHPFDVDALLLAAELSRMAGDWAQALSFFEQVQAIQPVNVSAGLGVVSIMLARQLYVEAKQAVEQLIVVVPDNALAHYFLGVIAYKQTQYAAAYSAIRAALKLNPQHRDSYRLLGAILFKQKRYPEAQEKLQQLLDWVPNHLSASKMLAAVYLQQQQPHKALVLLRPFEQQGNGDVSALIGSAYLQMGRYNESAKYLAQAVKQSPGSAGIRAQHQLSLIALGAGDRTLVEADDGIALLGIIQALRRQDFDQSLLLIQAELKHTPKNPLLYNFLGAAYLGQQATAKAQVQFETALSIDPEFMLAALNLARIRLNAGDLAAAKRLYEKVLFKDRDNLQALMDLAWMSEQAGEPEAVLKWMKQASRGNPLAIAPRLYLNQYFLRQKQVKKAKDVTQALVDAHPKVPEWLMLHAKNLVLSGQWLKAEAAYRGVTEMDAGSALGFYRLAAVQLERGDYLNAKRHYQHALTLQANFFPAKAALVQLALLQHELAAALTAATALTQQHPEQAISFERLGDVHVAKQAFALAIQAYQTALAKGAHWNSVVKLFHAHQKMGQATLANQAIRDWLTQHPTDVRLRLMLASSLQQAGQLTEAAQQYQQVLKQDAQHIGALNNLAWLYFEQQDVRAIEYAEVAYALSPEHPGVLDTLGWLLLEQKALQRSLALLKKAIDKAPQDTQIRYHYAIVLHRNGRPKAAVIELKRVLLDAHFPERAAALTRLQTWRGETPER